MTRWQTWRDDPAHRHPLYHASPLADLAATGSWLIRARPELRYGYVLPPEFLSAKDWS